ncbi:YiiG family protein [Stenotrophomonas maltophilia]|nr:YiiG family protein [Stenotrophomonas maltophilia]
MTRCNRTLPIVSLISVVLLSSCDRIPDIAAADPTVEKANAYIECYNGVEQPIREGFLTYTAWIKDLKAGPTGNEAQPRSPGKVLSHRVEACGAIVTEAVAKTPSSPMDASAQQYQQAFQALNSQIEQVDGYFAREEFRRDGGKGMRAQHAPLMQAYSAFFGASEAFDVALEKYEEERQTARLKQIEEGEGRSPAFYHLRLMGDGKQLAMAFQVDSPDVAALRNRLADYEALLKEMRDAGVGKDDPWWGHVQRSAETLVSKAGRGIERIEQGKPITAEGLEAERKASGSWLQSDPPGSQGDIMKAYNDLVDDSNRPH